MRLLMRVCYDLHDQNLHIGKVRKSYATISFASARFNFLESLRADLVEGKILPFIRFIYRGIFFRDDTLKLFKICEWMITIGRSKEGVVGAMLEGDEDSNCTFGRFEAG